MCWPDPGEMLAVKTSLLGDDTAAMRAAEQWVKEEEGESGSGT